MWTREIDGYWLMFDVVAFDVCQVCYPLTLEAVPESIFKQDCSASSPDVSRCVMEPAPVEQTHGE